MTDIVAPRWLLAPKLVALLGLIAMLVIGVFGIAALTYESGDRVYNLSVVAALVGLVTTVAAVLWVAKTPRKGGAIAVLVISIVINPIWLLLLIRAFG